MATPTDSTLTPEDRDAKLRESSAQGIGGWLIVLGITLVISCLFQLVTLATGLRDVASVMHKLSDAWATYIYALLVVDVATVAAWFYVIYLFFSRRRSFPKWFVAIVLLNLATQVAVVAINYGVFNGRPTSNDVRDIGRIVVYCLIWFTYVATSRRVRYTFVH